MKIYGYEINQKALDYINEQEQKLSVIFKIDEAIRERNQYKVLSAFQKNRLSETHFYGTTGYGYGDTGRETIENIFADIFETEDALVRSQIISGTQAISICMYACLRPGDRLLSVTGAPYDTLMSVIGKKGDGTGSLADFGIGYSHVEMKSDGKPDINAIKTAIQDDVKLVLIQRSRGYTSRPALGIDEIGELIKAVRSVKHDIVIMVDNCYGEFTDMSEPSSVGADLIVGSLIKNPGGGIAPTGGYICGKRELVEKCAYRVTVPGQGKEVGPSLGINRQIIQGIYFAPHVVCEAIKGAQLTAAVFEKLGYTVSPRADDVRNDIVQTITLHSPDELTAFCKGIQSASAIDSFVSPEAWDMPGYDSPVIMAAGGFTGGASIELSADAPMKPPYRVYMQGGLVYDQVKLALMLILTNMGDL